MSERRVPITGRIPDIRIMNPDKLTSSASIASSRSGPRVGKLRTTETIMLPLTKDGNKYPTVLTKGFIATLTGYLSINLNGDSPLDLAVNT